jgi:hypothetical protein
MPTESDLKTTLARISSAVGALSAAIAELVQSILTTFTRLAEAVKTLYRTLSQHADTATYRRVRRASPNGPLLGPGKSTCRPRL